MSPNTLRVLQAQTPEMQEFRDFLYSEIAKLDRVADITGDATHFGLEVLARQHAVRVLTSIFEPLLGVNNSTSANLSDYVVE